jgi:glycosyltransferase involved in cell wall biosynthesis
VPAPEWKKSGGAGLAGAGAGMRILLWHGYLLDGTGSNVYTRAIAREWGRAGHEVVVFCQEPRPERFDLGGAEVVRPPIAGLLPVFVLDRYDGLEPVLLHEMTREERERYVALNAGTLSAYLPADLVFANHVLMGAPVAAATGARFAVKAHGSELEYSMRGNAELQAWGAHALAEADAVFVGSAHIRSVLEDVVGHVDRVYEVPPGVDVEQFTLKGHDEAFAALLAECLADRPNPGNRQERLPDEGNAARLEEFLAGDAPTVLYFGKLLYNKGVHVLLEALHGMDVRTVVVGFGDYRHELERIAPPRTLFTGPLGHRHLVQLIPLADVAVVPSIFPEAFGMVAAEAAAAGCAPLVARHSGLEEIALGLEEAYPPELRRLASFETGDSLDLGDKLHDLLALPPARRRELGRAARGVAVEKWSWAGVAARLLEPFQPL